MRISILVLFLIASIYSCTNSSAPTETSVLGNAKETVVKKLKKSITVYADEKFNPRTAVDGEVVFAPQVKDWTGGFYPGCLWYLYEITGEESAKEAAHKHSKLIEVEKFNGKTHDMGFKMYCSFGNGYRLTKNEEYKEILLQSAKTLITRFNPTVGCLRSWDHHAHVWDFPVIIDNMLNLELLMWAFKETNDSVYYNIATSHANTTMKNHFREDNSTWHVISYDTITGEVMKRNTHQGYSDESAWARGQAWGLYGYTMMYRETGIDAYLEQAEKIAAYVLNHKHLPEDMIPYWDFNAPDIPNAPRDASAGAVISSALFELSTLAKTNGAKYYEVADKILTSLCSENYLAAEGATHSFLLEHSTGHLPDGLEIDEPIIYADYYFLEAMLRKIDLDANKQ